MNRKEIIEKLKQPFCYGLLKQTNPELAAEAEAIGLKKFEVWDRNDISKPEWCDGDECLSFDERCTYRLKPYYTEPALDLPDGLWAGERSDHKGNCNYWYKIPGELSTWTPSSIMDRKDFRLWLFSDGTTSREFCRYINGVFDIPAHALFKEGGE